MDIDYSKLTPPDHGFVVLGAGRSFELLRHQTHFMAVSARWMADIGRFADWTYGAPDRRYMKQVTGSSSVLVYAVHPDDPLVHHNIDRVNEIRRLMGILGPPSTGPEIFANLTTQTSHILLFDGKPMSDLGEFVAASHTYFENADNCHTMVHAIWNAREAADPEAEIFHLIDTEPVLLSMVDFQKRPISGGDSETPVFAMTVHPISDLIVRAAAGALLGGGLSDHFHFTENRTIVINPQNPPTVDQAGEIIKRTLQIKETGDKLDNFSCWALGMLLYECKRYFADDFDVSNYIEATKKSHSTVSNALSVYEAFKENRKDLSFTHHREVHFANITPEQKEFVLSTSERLRLSVMDQRKLISYVRIYGQESLEQNMPEDSDTLMERLEVRSAVKNFMFLFQGTWYRYRGPYEAIPSGARPIFNADTMARHDVDSPTPQPMPVWTPVGIALPAPVGHRASLERARQTSIETGEPIQPSNRGGDGNRIGVDGVVMPTGEEAQQAVDEARNVMG